MRHAKSEFNQMKDAVKRKSKDEFDKVSLYMKYVDSPLSKLGMK